MSSFFNTIFTIPPSIEQLEKARLSLSALTEAGTTAQRPTVNLWIGRAYFDTTLGFEIHYNGTVWVRYDGTGV